MEAWAIIAARGGAQQVELKNIAPVLGRPALAYTLDHARQARSLRRIIVSTEDPRIATVAREEGAEVLDRPAELSQATSRLDHVLRHAVQSLVARRPPDAVVLLYGAVPIRPVGIIDRSIETLATTGADSVRSVCRAVEHHPLWSVRLDPEKRIIEHLGKLTIYRRQELPPACYYSGACLAVRTSTLMNADPADTDPFAWLGKDQRGETHEPDECVEIHEPRDLEWAEFLLSRSKGRS